MIHSRIHRQRGFTMVESLVALVVLSVGLLGIASLYVTSLRTGRTAMIRTQAVTLVGDMADRIRANPGGSYAGSGPGADRGCVNGGGDCSADDLAADDWFRWLGDLHRRLPAGATAVIEEQAGAPVRQVAITLSWPEAGQEAPVTYSLALQL